MNMKKGFLLALTAALLLLAGCTTPKKASYLLDMAANTDYPANAAPELILQKGDMINVQILSENPELSAPFQIAVGENKTDNVYTIDAKGDIDFPILGTLSVGGLTIKQVERLVAKKIVEGGYIKHPTVRVTLDNFTITVIGQSGNSVVPVKGSSINLLQALAQTGGIRPNSNIKKITVIRTADGTRKSYEVDLQSKDLFDSPVYYLQQNDIIYVKPKGITLSATGQSTLSIVTAGLTIINIITNYLLWSSRN